MSQPQLPDENQLLDTIAREVSTGFHIPEHNDVEIQYALTAYPSKPTYMTFRLNNTAVFWLMFTYDAAGNLTRIQPD